MTEQRRSTIKCPKISDAKQIAGLYGLSKVVVLFQLADGRWGYASYGRDRAHCELARVAGDVALEAVQWRREL